jgi:hypothetical protein
VAWGRCYYFKNIFAKKWWFLLTTLLICICEDCIITLSFEKNAKNFCRRLGKIAK